MHTVLRLERTLADSACAPLAFEVARLRAVAPAFAPAFAHAHSAVAFQVNRQCDVLQRECIGRR